MTTHQGFRPVRSQTGKVIHWANSDRSLCGTVGRAAVERPGYPVTCRVCLRLMGPLGRIGAGSVELIEDRWVLAEALRDIVAGVENPVVTARIALSVVDARHAARVARHEARMAEAS